MYFKLLIRMTVITPTVCFW